jgi:hypothetical protein
MKEICTKIGQLLAIAFSDPDGNEWLLQEVTARLPGRVDGQLTTTSSTGLVAAPRRGRARRAREVQPRPTG